MISAMASLFIAAGPAAIWMIMADGRRLAPATKVDFERRRLARERQTQALDGRSA
jgi:hypothetical protein